MTQSKRTERDTSLKDYKKKKREEQEKYEEAIEQDDLSELSVPRLRDLDGTK